MIRDYFRISFANLRQRRLRSWLTMIGIFIGIAAVISLIGLGEGLRTAITNQFGFLGTDIISVQASGIGFSGPPGSGVVDPLDEDLAETLARINGVKAAFGRRIETGTIEFNDFFGVGFFGSVPSGKNRDIFETMTNLKAEQGRLLREDDKGKVLVGNSFLKTDDNENGFIAGDSLLIQDEEFEVVGILERKGSFTFDNAILMNEEDMDDVFGDTQSTDVIAVQVEDEEDIPQIRESIEKVLRDERDVKAGEENFEVSTPQQTLEALNSSIYAVQLFVYIIAAISILVGGIGIMNTMYTAILERTKEIGIMKAIGAKNSTILTFFLIESGFLGMVGGIIGILLGLGLAYGLAALGRIFLGADLIQATVTTYHILGALLGSFGLGTFFGVLPAWRASKLHPVEALRE